MGRIYAITRQGCWAAVMWIVAGTAVADDFLEKVDQLEQDQEERLEAAAQEELRQAQREQAFTELEVPLQQKASRYWAATETLRERGGPEAVEAVQDFIEQIDSEMDLEFTDETGTHTQRARIPELERAWSWLATTPYESIEELDEELEEELEEVERDVEEVEGLPVASVSDCWDLNQNQRGDPGEDVDGNGVLNSWDCPAVEVSDVKVKRRVQPRFPAAAMETRISPSAKSPMEDHAPSSGTASVESSQPLNSSHTVRSRAPASEASMVLSEVTVSQSFDPSE